MFDIKLVNYRCIFHQSVSTMTSYKKKKKISRSKIMSLETNAMQFPACRFGKAKDYKQMTGQRRRLEIS